MKLEDSFVQLEEIIVKLENKETSLEDAFKEYQKGLKLIKECNDSLDRVEKEIVVLQQENRTDKGNE